MPRTSGLFEYVKQRFSREGIAFTILNENVADKSPSILYALPIDKDPNPFSSRGFAWFSRPRHSAHLRIDLHYHSSASEFLSRRNLSYCHGTEYFFRDKEILQVHYYFDQFGNYKKAMVKLKPSGENVKLSLKEEDILEERALKYSAEVQKLIKQKQQDFTELTDAIEKKHEAILLKLQKSFNKSEALVEIDELIALVAQKNSFEDLRHHSAAPKFLIRSLYALRDQISSEESTSKPASTSKAAATLEEEEEVVATASPPKAKAAAKTKKQLVAERVGAELTKYEQSISRLIKLYPSIQSIDSTNVDEYLKHLAEIRLDLLSISLNSGITAKQTAKVAQLNTRMNALPTEIELFKNAVLSGNLDLVKALFPYCEDLVSNRLYFDLIFDWVRNSNNKAMSDKKELIFNFLSETCPVFNNFIQKASEIHILDTENNNIQYNFAFIAFGHRNENVFAALFRYGLDPRAPMYVAETMLSPFKLLAIANPVNSDFYLKTLVEYGYTLRHKQPYEDSAVVKSQDELARSDLSAKARGELKRSLQRYSELATSFEMPDINLTQAAFQEQKIPLHPLFDFCFNVADYFNYPKLFEFLLKQATLFDLLTTTGAFLINAQVLALLPRLETSGVECLAMQVFQAHADELNETPGELWHIAFSFANPQQLENGKLLLAALRDKISATTDISIVMAELEKNAKDLSMHKNYPEAASTYLALFTLYTLKPGDLSVEMRINQAKQLFAAGLALEQQAKQTNSQVSVSFSTKAAKIYILLINLVCDDPGEELYNTKFVQAAIKNLRNLIEDGIDPNARAPYEKHLNMLVAKKATPPPPSYQALKPGKI